MMQTRKLDGYDQPSPLRRRLVETCIDPSVFRAQCEMLRCRPDLRQTLPEKRLAAAMDGGVHVLSTAELKLLLHDVLALLALRFRLLHEVTPAWAEAIARYGAQRMRTRIARGVVREKTRAPECRPTRR